MVVVERFSKYEVKNPAVPKFMENAVEVAPWETLVMLNASPVCPVRTLRARRFEVVEVAETVRTDLTSAEVVPMATLSVTV